MILRLKCRIPEVESAAAPRNPWISGRVDELRAADAAKPNHKGIRNGHGVNSGELIDFNQIVPISIGDEDVFNVCRAGLVLRLHF